MHLIYSGLFQTDSDTKKSSMMDSVWPSILIFFRFLPFSSSLIYFRWYTPNALPPAIGQHCPVVNCVCLRLLLPWPLSWSTSPRTAVALCGTGAKAVFSGTWRDQHLRDDRGLFCLVSEFWTLISVKPYFGFKKPLIKQVHKVIYLVSLTK